MGTRVLSVEDSMLREEDLQRLRELRLIDDDFMTKVFDGHNESVELVLQIILRKPDLKVLDVRTQVFAMNLLKRSVRFDVLATDAAGRNFNIEIQRADKGAGRKRARYNSSMLDKYLLEKGLEFNDLPETYVIFIVEKDILKAGFPIYHIERWIEETKELFHDDEHILYVNGSYRDDTPIGKLMHDFSCTKSEEMNYPILANRVRYFKETEEGRGIMCQAIEDLANERVKHRTLEIVEGIMTKMNWSAEQALEFVTVTEEEKRYILDSLKSA